MYKTNNHVHTGRAVVARAAAAAPDALREWSSSLPRGDEFCLFLKTGTPFWVACLGACKEEGAGNITSMMRGCLRCLNMERRSRRGKNKKTASRISPNRRGIGAAVAIVGVCETWTGRRHRVQKYRIPGSECPRCLRRAPAAADLVLDWVHFIDDSALAHPRKSHWDFRSSNPACIFTEMIERP